MKRGSIDLEGAVVLVTGGGRGIGRAAGEAFAKRGARVFLGDVDETAATTAARELGRGTVGLPLDVRSQESFDAFVRAATERHGAVDVLVNNAGVMPVGAFLDQSPAVDRLVFDVNVWGIVHGARAVLPSMIAKGRGHLVNVASMAGKIPVPGLALYNASKFAAVGLSGALRRELSETGVTVSAVLPSAVRTGLVSGLALGGGMPTVEPEDVARAIVETCRHRRAEVSVPGYLLAWDLVSAVLPERVLSAFRDVLNDRRVLSVVDHAGRRDYADRVTRQAGARAAGG